MVFKCWTGRFRSTSCPYPNHMKWNWLTLFSSSIFIYLIKLRYGFSNILVNQKAEQLNCWQSVNSTRARFISSYFCNYRRVKNLRYSRECNRCSVSTLWHLIQIINIGFHGLNLSPIAFLLHRAHLEKIMKMRFVRRRYVTRTSCGIHHSIFV